MATIDQNLFRPKTKVFRKVTVGENTIILDALGNEGATFRPIAFFVSRVYRGYRHSEGQFKTKKEAVEHFNKVIEFYKRFD